MYQWTGNVGLVNVTDILKASINSLCTSASYSWIHYRDDSCTNNYLLDNNDAIQYWTITALSTKDGNYTQAAWVTDYNDVTNNDVYSKLFSPCSVVFLKSNLFLSGSGTESDPFTIM